MTPTGSDSFKGNESVRFKGSDEKWLDEILFSLTDQSADTRGSFYCSNICIWWDGAIRPARGHNGNCIWGFDGQVYYHKSIKSGKGE